MNKDLKKYVVEGFIVVSVLGTVFHFVYDFLGQNFFIGFFFPVNESTWEHMKLLFFPMLFYSLYMNHKLKTDYPCITSSLLFGILLGTVLVPVLFFTYSGILGKNFLPLDIATFVISVILAFFAVYKLTLSCKVISYKSLLRLLVFIVAVCFLIFTYHPLAVGIFEVPTP